MSFQTFNLFNFFQQPNTGVFKSLSVEERDIATNYQLNNSGAVADFNWFFPYANKTIPNAIILGEAFAFPITLLSDSIETENSILGIRHPKTKVYLSGKFLKDINSFPFQISFSGRAFPKELDEENEKIYISGLITGEPPSLEILKLNISGNVIEDKSDIFNFKNKISGEISKLIIDFPSIKTILTGIIEKENLDLKLFENKISGNFYPLFKDFSNIEYSLISYSTGKGVSFISQNLNDEINNLSYFMQSYSKSDN